jgi:hypothetical protein
MKYLSFVVVGIFGALLATCADRVILRSVHTVYVLPMGNGVDQFLANQLTVQGVYQVTTDATKADAFLSDRVGRAFDDQVEDVLPAPPKKDEEAKKREAKKDEKKADGALPEFPETAPVVSKGFARSKGNYYLVSRETRAVLWSTFARPKDLRAESLDGVAQKVVGRLKRDLTEKPKAQ